MGTARTWPEVGHYEHVWLDADCNVGRLGGGWRSPQRPIHARPLPRRWPMGSLVENWGDRTRDGELFSPPLRGGLESSTSGVGEMNGTLETLGWGGGMRLRGMGGGGGYV